MNCEYETPSWTRGLSNCLNTVNSTSAITSHTAAFENILLFKAPLLHLDARLNLPCDTTKTSESSPQTPAIRFSYRINSIAGAHAGRPTRAASDAYPK